MNREFWLDGFNFFYHWDSTKGLLRPDSGFDIVRAIDRSLRILSRHLGRKAGSTVVYLDGGLARSETRLAGLRVRYCGPGKKADDRLLVDLGELGDNARLVTAVSNDRELKANLRSYGASCMGVGEFLAVLEGRRGPGGKGGGQAAGGRGGKGKTVNPTAKGEEAEVMREKTRHLSPAEVKAWLEFFGIEAEE